MRDLRNQRNLNSADQSYIYIYIYIYIYMYMYIDR